MIAIPRAHQTNCLGSPVRKDQISVEIDIRVWNNTLAFFPVEGRHPQTAASNSKCRLIVAAFILSALRDDHCGFSFNQTVLDHMQGVGSRNREKLVDYFEQSRFAKVEVNYSTDHHSIIRKLSGARIQQCPTYQHNIVRAGNVGKKNVVSSRFHSLPVRWQFTGTTETVNLPLNWYRDYGQSYRNACSRLYPDQWQFVPCIESSVAQCVISLPTYEECLDLAKRNPKKNADDISPEQKAHIWLSMWKEWQQNPLLYLFRTAGRCYYPLVNQPKVLRHRHLKFHHNGRIENAAEVDMSATYWVLLANMLDSSHCRDRLVQDLVDGCFYQRLNSGITNSYADPAELKVAVQKECLFGRRNFGKTRLFVAMERIYPDLALFIRYRRRRHSVRWFSDCLTNAESAFFIDRLLPFVVNAGISALPIHDALIVPTSVAGQVEAWSRDLAESHFGFAPKFKTKICDAIA